MRERSSSFAYYRGEKPPSFATESEREAARILDFYRVPWSYEPRTFVLEQDEQGNILEAFTPDFYLPDLDLFIEVTQMKQSLVTAKNRKVRKLRERYPDVNVKLLYRNDFLQLAKKFRREAAAGGAGTTTAEPSLTDNRQLQAPLSPTSMVGDVYLTEEQIARRVTELAAQIDRDHRGFELHLVSLLKGAVFFLTDLARALSLPVTLDFMAVSGYDSGSAGRGGTPTVRLLKDLEGPIEGKHVLVVEDIVDTGLTLHYVLRTLSLRQPASLEVCTLLDRPYRRLADVTVRYVGFTVPDDFFVGYGFDHHQRYRNLPYLAHLRE